MDPKSTINAAQREIDPGTHVNKSLVDSEGNTL